MFQIGFKNIKKKEDQMSGTETETAKVEYIIAANKRRNALSAQRAFKDAGITVVTEVGESTNSFVVLDTPQHVQEIAGRRKVFFELNRNPLD